MGNHTATRARGGGKRGHTRGGSGPSGKGNTAPTAVRAVRWQGGGGEPATTFLDHSPTTDSARPTVYTSPTQRAAIHLQALGTVGLHREAVSGFDALGRRIFTKDGGRSEVRFGPEDLATLQGQAVLHNHPAGSSFSPTDVNTGARYEMTMHVVGAPPLPPGADPTRTSRGPVYLYTMRYGPVPPGIARGSAAHADYLLARAARIQAAYDRVDAETRREYVARLYTHTMSLDQAELAHYHQVWNQVANALPDDLSYTWEILTP